MPPFRGTWHAGYQTEASSVWLQNDNDAVGSVRRLDSSGLIVQLASLTFHQLEPPFWLSEAPGR